MGELLPSRNTCKYHMFVESFHHTLKEVYFERKQNRRVHHLLFKLQKISRDKAYEQLIKAEKEKATMRQRENMKRHKQAELLPANALSKRDTDCWEYIFKKRGQKQMYSSSNIESQGWTLNSKR